MMDIRLWSNVAKGDQDQRRARWCRFAEPLVAEFPFRRTPFASLGVAVITTRRGLPRPRNATCLAHKKEARFLGNRASWVYALVRRLAAIAGNGDERRQGVDFLLVVTLGGVAEGGVPGA